MSLVSASCCLFYIYIFSTKNKRDSGDFDSVTLAFIPSDGRSLSSLSFIPDHLIGIGKGVMAVSRTLAWWSYCSTICAICVAQLHQTLIISSIFMHTQSLSRPCRRSWIHNYLNAFQLGAERGTKQNKKGGTERRDPRGSTWCR